MLTFNKSRRNICNNNPKDGSFKSLRFTSHYLEGVSCDRHNDE